MTPKQKQLLDFIKDRLSATQVCPSYQEMADALGIKAKSGVHRLVHALIAHGEIERIDGMARSITLPSPKRRSDAAKWVQVSRIAKDIRTYRVTRDEAAARLLNLAGRL